MKLILLPWLLILSLRCHAAAADLAKLMTEEFEPFQHYEDGHLTGLSVEIVRAVQKEIGSADSILVYPWNRGVRLLETTKNSALFSTARMPTREKKYKWVGPLAELRLVFFKKTDSPIVLKSVEDAKRYKVGATKGVATHEALLEAGFTNLDVLGSGADEMNIRKLLKGRIDLWPTSYFAGLYSARKMGYEGQIKPLQGADIMVGQLYLAFNKDTEESIISRWQGGLDKLRVDGVIDTILAKYAE